MRAITVTRSFSEVTRDDLRGSEPTHEEPVGADDPYVGDDPLRESVEIAERHRVEMGDPASSTTAAAFHLANL